MITNTRSYGWTSYGLKNYITKFESCGSYVCLAYKCQTLFGRSVFKFENAICSSFFVYHSTIIYFVYFFYHIFLFFTTSSNFLVKTSSVRGILCLLSLSFLLKSEIKIKVLLGFMLTIETFICLSSRIESNWKTTGKVGEEANGKK